MAPTQLRTPPADASRCAAHDRHGCSAARERVAAAGELGLLARARAAGRRRSRRCSRCCSSPRPLEIVLDGALGHSPLIPKSPDDRRLAAGHRRAPRLPRLSDRAARRSRPPTRGCCALVGRSRGGRAISKRWAIALVGALHADRVRRADPALDRRLQLHRLRAHGRRARPQPLSARSGRDRRRPRLPLRRARTGCTCATAYGPLYTLLSYPLAPLGLRGRAVGR